MDNEAHSSEVVEIDSIARAKTGTFLQTTAKSYHDNALELMMTCMSVDEVMKHMEEKLQFLKEFRNEPESLN